MRGKAAEPFIRHMKREAVAERIFCRRNRGIERRVRKRTSSRDGIRFRSYAHGTFDAVVAPAKRRYEEAIPPVPLPDSHGGFSVVRGRRVSGHQILQVIR